MTTPISLDEVRRKRRIMEFSNYDKQCVLVSNIEGNGELLLKSILNKSNLVDRADVIFHAWPNLEKSSILFCEMLGLEFPGAGMPLIEQVIGKAFAAYIASASSCEPEVVSMVKYLAVLSNAAYEIQKFIVYAIDAKGGVVTWVNFSMPISKWARLNKLDSFFIGLGVQPNFETLIGGHILFSTKIMSQSDLGRMNFFKSEDQLTHSVR